MDNPAQQNRNNMQVSAAPNQPIQNASQPPAQTMTISPQPPPRPTPPTTLPPNNSQIPNGHNKKRISIILSLIVFIFIIIATTGFVFRDQIVSIFYPTPTLAPSPIATVTPTPDPMTNWKTYSGNGFSFVYPPEWNYGSQEDGTILFSKEIRQTLKSDTEPLPTTTTVRFKVTERQPDESLNNWVGKEIERRDLANYEPIVATIRAAGTSAIETEFPSQLGEKVTVFMDEKNVYVITLEYANAEEKFAQEEFRTQILSTFEFENK